MSIDYGNRLKIKKNYIFPKIFNTLEVEFKFFLIFSSNRRIEN